MQTMLRSGVAVSCAAGAHAPRHQQGCPASTSGRAPVCVVPRRLAGAAPRAIKDEQAELDRIAREANQPDIWDNELVGNGLKVALVAGIVAVAIFIGRLGEPIAENTIKSFPTPAEYEAYEESK